MLRDVEEGSARSSPAHLAQLQRHTLLGQKKGPAGRSELTHHALNLSQA